MTAPIWLLDVDGVINASRAGWSAAPRSASAYAQAGGMRFRLHWEPRLIDRIRTLHRSGVVEVRWCTTWCAYADELERLWGLPALNRAFTDDINGTAASMAKLAAARQVLADGHRLIWTDDMEVPRLGPLYDELTRSGRALLIRPSARRGLRSEDMDVIEDWAAMPATAAA